MENDGIFEETFYRVNRLVRSNGSVLKKTGKFEYVLNKLYEAVKRGIYVLPTLEDVAPKFAGTKIFSTLDASIWVYQLPLVKESAKPTMFITLMGRFCFRHISFGNTSSFERSLKRSEGSRPPDNSHIRKSEMLYYGHIISGGGVNLEA